MKTPAVPPFRYNFRAPGTPAESTIRYAVGDTRLSLLLVGRSQRGICAIFLGDEVQALQVQLAAAFPHSELQADQAALQREFDQIASFIDRGQSKDMIDLDIGGSAFEQQVWRALCAIPAGETRSYGGVAAALGMTTAVRAVARACAANVLALAIPCHRVVRGDGSLAGYRWGVQRKHALLAVESARERAA